MALRVGLPVVGGPAAVGPIRLALVLAFVACGVVASRDRVEPSADRSGAVSGAEHERVAVTDVDSADADGGRGRPPPHTSEPHAGHHLYKPPKPPPPPTQPTAPPTHAPTVMQPRAGAVVLTDDLTVEWCVCGT